jgi:hypothetical protein
MMKDNKMKITRRQLRRLIAEMARTPVEDPRKDLAKYLDPEQMQKIQNLYDTGDEETLAQIDAISDAFGGSPYFSGLMSRYGVEPIMNEFEFAEAYLSTDQLKQLMQAKGKELVMVFDEWYDVVGFQDSSTRDSIIDPVELHKMVVLVEAKQPQFGGKVLIDDLEHPDKSANYYQTLFKFLEAIIKVSKITYTSEHYAAALGMGEYGHTTDGSYSLHSPFSELQESGKLFLGYPAKRNT